MGASGILSVVKPKGPTSHDVVDEIRRLFGERRVGHAGTLDPAASGVLIVGVGKATRILRYFHLLDKTYDAVIAFGVSTSTLDADGEPIETSTVDFTSDDLRSALAALVGETYQIPPMVSALKSGGEPLYKKALRGEWVEREPRRQFVYDISLTAEPAKGPDGLTSAGIRVCCDSGTYVRRLASDVARSVGTVGHLASLERRAVGPFRLETSSTLGRIGSMSSEERSSALLWGRKAVPHLPWVRLEGGVASEVSHGKPPLLDPRTAEGITESLKVALAEIPHLEDALVHEGVLTEGESTGDLQADRGDTSVPAGVALEDGRLFTGPTALVAEDGSLIAIARPSGGILAFDCVLV